MPLVDFINPEKRLNCYFPIMPTALDIHVKCPEFPEIFWAHCLLNYVRLYHISKPFIMFISSKILTQVQSGSWWLINMGNLVKYQIRLITLPPISVIWSCCINLIKSPRPLRAAFDRKCFLIPDKQTEILDCIPCVMVIQKLERQQTNGRMDMTKRIISLASRSIIRLVQYDQFREIKAVVAQA